MQEIIIIVFLIDIYYYIYFLGIICIIYRSHYILPIEFIQYQLLYKHQAYLYFLGMCGIKVIFFFFKQVKNVILTWRATFALKTIEGSK